MTNKQIKRHTFTILLMLMLGTLTSTALRAQKPAEAKAASPSGPKEGIKVHGSWTIEIRNPDGKLVTRREFENALTQDGAYVLGLYLQGNIRTGGWRLVIRDAFGNQPCLNGSNPASCGIHEPDSTSPATNVFKTLAISPDAANPANTVLAGTATAQKDGAVTVVETFLGFCSTQTGSCGAMAGAFSFKQISPINVVAGQIIQVTVVISFS